MQTSLKETGKKAESSKPEKQEFPRTWNFQAWENPDNAEIEKKDGDYVEGTVTEIEKVESKKGALGYRLRLDIGDEEVTVWAYRKVLKDLLEENEIEKGDRIGIEYKGKAKGKDYYLYDLYLEK